MCSMSWKGVGEKIDDLFNFSVSPKYLKKVIIWNWWVQIKNYQSPLIHVFVWRVILVFKFKFSHESVIEFNMGQIFEEKSCFNLWDWKVNIQLPSP